MRDDDEQKLDPDTLSAYERLEQIMREQVTLAPDLQGNVFRQEWIDAAIKKGQEMLEYDEPEPPPRQVARLDHVTLDGEQEPYGPKQFQARYGYLGMERQTTSGMLPPTPPSGLWPWRDQLPDADGLYRLEPPAKTLDEPWWLEQRRAFQERLLTLLAIPADYLTEAHREDLNALLDDLRREIAVKVSGAFW